MSIGTLPSGFSASGTFTGQILAWSGTAWSPQSNLLAGSGFVSFGSGGNFTNVATTGGLRFKNNVAMVAARNAAGNADVIAVESDTSNRILIGGGSAGVNLYVSSSAILSATSTLLSTTVPIALAGTVASTGDIRAANNSTIIAARNAANSADIAVLGTNASNQILIGGSVYSAPVTPAYAGIYKNTGTPTVPVTGAAITTWDGSTVTASGVTVSTINGTLTVGTAGVYEILFSIGALYGSGVQSIYFYLANNGTILSGTGRRSGLVAQTGTRDIDVAISTIVTLAANDVITACWYDAQGTIAVTFAAGVPSVGSAVSQAILAIKRVA